MDPWDLNYRYCLTVLIYLSRNAVILYYCNAVLLPPLLLHPNFARSFSAGVNKKTRSVKNFFLFLAIMQHVCVEEVSYYLSQLTMKL